MNRHSKLSNKKTHNENHKASGIEDFTMEQFTKITQCIKCKDQYLENPKIGKCGKCGGYEFEELDIYIFDPKCKICKSSSIELQKMKQNNRIRVSVVCRTCGMIDVN